MANIKKLEMVSELTARNDISITSSFFGLCTKAKYLPTGSELVVFKQDFQLEDASRIERLLDTPVGRLASATADVRLTKTAVGNVRLEGCMSRDGQFLAVQLLRFSDYLYRPVSEPHFYEGAAARLLAEVFIKRKN